MDFHIIQTIIMLKFTLSHLFSGYNFTFPRFSVLKLQSLNGAQSTPTSNLSLEHNKMTPPRKLSELAGRIFYVLYSTFVLFTVVLESLRLPKYGNRNWDFNSFMEVEI